MNQQEMTPEDVAVDGMEDVMSEAVDDEVVEAEIVEQPPAVVTAAELGLDLPTEPEAREAALVHEIARGRAEATEYLDTLQRIAAEFDNYRKRVERDRGDIVTRASQRLVESLLPTLDAFDAAMAYESQTPAEEKILDGVRGTYAQMMETLGREGFEVIAADGVPFDPAVHEAVAGGGDGDLVVAKELRRGYTLRGRVVRPALVTVEETS